MWKKKEIVIVLSFIIVLSVMFTIAVFNMPDDSTAYSLESEEAEVIDNDKL